MYDELTPMNYLEISQEALIHNACAIKAYVSCPVIAVLKCDGYGVSLQEAARIWKRCGTAKYAFPVQQETVYLAFFGKRGTANAEENQIPPRRA